MKIISIDNKDIAFLSLFLTFGEIQPCLFQYLEKEGIDLPQFSSNTNSSSNDIKSRLFDVSPQLLKEYNTYTKSNISTHTPTTTTIPTSTPTSTPPEINKPTPYIVFNIPKVVPNYEILQNRFNDVLFFCVDFLFNYITAEHITVIDKIAQHNTEASFIDTLHNSINNTNDTFLETHSMTIIIDSNISRDLIVKYGIVNLLNGKTNKMPYDELHYFFNTYQLNWLKYIKGGYKKMLVIYLCNLSFYKHNKYLIAFKYQNNRLMKLIKTLIFTFANPDTEIKVLGPPSGIDNTADMSYDSSKIKSYYYLSFKNYKIARFTSNTFDKLFDCRGLFPQFKKEFISINQMFYYNSLLNQIFK